MNFTHIPTVVSLYNLQYAIDWALKNSTRRTPTIPGVQKKHPSPWVQFYMNPGIKAPIEPSSNSEEVTSLITSMLALLKKLMPLAPESESFLPELLPSDLLISMDVAVVLDAMLDDVEKLEKEPEPEAVADEEVRTFWIEEVAIVEKLQKPQELKATATSSSQTFPSFSDLLDSRDVAMVMDDILKELGKKEKKATIGTQTEVLPSDLLFQRDIVVVLESILDELEKREKAPEPQPIAHKEVHTMSVYFGTSVVLEKLQSPQVSTWSSGCQATPSSSSNVPELIRKLRQVRSKEQKRKRDVVQQAPLAVGSPEFHAKWKEAMEYHKGCEIYKDPFFKTLKNIFDPKKISELPQKVSDRAVSAAELFNAYKKANPIGASWRGLDAAEKAEWDDRKKKLDDEHLDQLKKGFIYTRELGEPANKVPRATNGEAKR
ncbi:hypothetical protein B9Z55_007410 [Caenorhabditis nigoni]|uniref:Uncharacterized protein n=1 Tax=Caenorhabditis nigoni TaxID=1611254 RepID=A0A2G5V9H4_9PELO|nr:hypothetical protein B9Z55_007410 [Caenorhabditis nigoni]